MALALYRRYRPDTFDGVIGRDQVTVPLMRALDENKLTHAYLFSGPRGCGKTSSARVSGVASTARKVRPRTRAANAPAARDLATGGPGSIDVVEIDAASHNGVTMPANCANVRIRPARDRYKFSIRRGPHGHAARASNALLKIVEEPPEHVMFIFATTGTRQGDRHHPFLHPPLSVPSGAAGGYGPVPRADLRRRAYRGRSGCCLAMRAGGGSVRDTFPCLTS